MVIDETLLQLRRLYGAEFESIAIERIVIGISFTAVKLYALSRPFLNEERCRIVYDTDALDLIDMKSAGKIGMVGAFIPFLKPIGRFAAALARTGRRTGPASGHDVLDQNVIQTIRNVEPFPKPPLKTELVIPVVYRLQ